MSLAQYPLGDAALADAASSTATKKTPPKRQAVAIADRKLVPEPR